MTGTATSVRDLTPSTDPAINGLISLQVWSGAITYAFPTVGTDYGTDYDTDQNLTGFNPISAAQITAAHFALDADVGPAASAGFSIEGFTLANISAGAGTTSTLRIATSTSLDVGAGFAFLPEDNQTAGDIWFYSPEAAQVGNYEWSTLLHEIGHAMGLEHAHEGTVVPAQFDHLAYTIMSYRSFQGASVEGGSSTGTFGFPQTFMMYDIATLQYMYGANYTVNNTDTVYSWNPGSGDTLVNGAIGVDAVDPTIFATIWDGGGIDTYDLSTFSTNLTLNLTAGADNLFNSAQLADLGAGNVPTGNIYNALLFEGNTNSLIENAIGGSGNDTITGNEVSNVLTGNGGNDILDGGAGTDYAAYNGVQANYTITTNANGSFSITGEGTDTVTNVEFARFTDGDVALSADASGDINGTPGDDNPLNGTAGDDVINGLAGNDRINGGDGNDTIIGGAGADQIFGDAGTDTVSGGLGDDYLHIDALDIIDGGDGYDRVFAVATSGALNIDLAASNVEQVRGANQADVLEGSASTVALILYGNGRNDILSGGSAADFIHGGAGDDTLNGGAGNDILNGLTNADTINGGDGDDIMFVDDQDTLDGGNGYDRIYVQGFSGDTNFDLGASNIEFANGNIANDTFNAASSTVSVKLLGQAGNDTLIGGSANDQLYGSLGNDTLDGGAGNDIINASQGADSLTGGAGDDIIFVDNLDTFVDGGAGYDRVYANGGSGAITLDLTAANVEYASGSEAGDSYTAAGTTVAVKLLGQGGNDALTGGSGNDLIYGQAGNDVISGGAGDDFMSGGAGVDSFVFEAGFGSDIITGFDTNSETLDFSALGITLADLTITSVGNNATIDYAGNSIFLIGVDASTLDASDFSF